MLSFFYPENVLLGERIWESSNGAIYKRSNAPLPRYAIVTKGEYDETIGAAAYLKELEELQHVMEKVYKMSERHEILKEEVPVEEKIFSI
jgi:hypothetical protein